MSTWPRSGQRPAAARPWGRRLAAAGVAALVLGSCGLAGAGSSGGTVAVDVAPAAEAPALPTGAVAPVAGPEVSAAALLPEGPARVVDEQAFVPFATAGGIELRLPSARVERIGYHQSAQDNARVLSTLPTAPRPVTLGSRDRPTEDRTAADVVVDPELEIRAPVSGRVLAANSYVLYCRYRDNLVIIEPDQHPGWQVKILHLAGTSVRVGQRVEAGLTPIAPGANRFPFVSQVDEVTFAPAWPHVHVEIDDPSIPNRPGAGC